MLARVLTIMLGLALAACATVSGKPERYVAQAPAALPAEFRDGKCEAGELDRLLAAYGRVGSTPMMALGDSLYNGMQSLHLNWWEAEWSTPALVALREGLIAADAQGNRTGERQFVAPP